MPWHVFKFRVECLERLLVWGRVVRVWIDGDINKADCPDWAIGLDRVCFVIFQTCRGMSLRVSVYLTIVLLTVLPRRTIHTEPAAGRSMRIPCRL